MWQLEFRGVSLDYASVEGASAHALADVSFGVAQGESLAIIGPSGCGKTSLLHLAAGLRAPTQGSVLVDGRELAGPSQSTALILQDFGLLPWKSVRANAELGLKLRGVGRAERRERAREALALVGLSGFEGRYPGELSGGMCQRLALARSLALDVSLLLMDEPLSALDALLREQLQDTLLALWAARGYAQVLVTHSIQEAVYLGRRIIVFSGRPGSVRACVDNPQAGSPGYRGSDAYFAQVNALRALLAGGSGQADAPVAASEQAAACASGVGEGGAHA